MKKIATVTLIILLATSVVLAGLVYKFRDPTLPIADDKEATSEAIKEVVDANNKFAVDFYKKIDTENAFFSPYSMSTAFGMVYEGANGETKKETQEVFHFPEDNNNRRSANAFIYNNLNQENDNYVLTTANSLWIHEEYKLLEGYTSTITKYYGGIATNMDFSNNAEESREVINDWVEEKTHDKIQELFPQGTINDQTRLVLANAIYFKGKWLIEFDEEETTDSDFKTPTGIVRVKMMKLLREKFNYYDNEQLQMLELPYKEKLSMLIILPREGESLENIEQSLTTDKINEWNKNLDEEEVRIFIPRFKMTNSYSLTEYLPDMGMHSAFTKNADFSGIDGTRDLSIQAAIHKSFIEVNEEGTEAAAATGISMRATSVGPGQEEIKVFRADRPFMFLIRDENNNILFMGRIANPQNTN